MTLWLLAVIPTRLPFWTNSQIIRAAVYVFPVPGGPCMGRDAKVRRARDAEGRIQRAIAVPANEFIPEVRSLAL